MSLEKLSEKDKPMEQIKSSILPRFSLKDIGRKLDKLDSEINPMLCRINWMDAEGKNRWAEN